MQEKPMQKHAMKLLSAIALSGVLALGWCGVAAAQGSTPGPFSQEQVNLGRNHFMENCAECHSKDLSGTAAPALAGKEFAGRWSNKSTAEFYKFIQATMPLCQGGLLGNATYAEIVAFLMWANGAQPGTADFDGKAEANIGSIITGTVRPDLTKTR